MYIDGGCPPSAPLVLYPTAQCQTSAQITEGAVAHNPIEGIVADMDPWMD